MADFVCPNCGSHTYSSFKVCKDCGKVFCPECNNKEGANRFGGDCCPRCGSTNYVFVSDWNEMREALRNSQN